MLTSAEIRRNREDYAAFIVHPETQEAMPVDEFCNHFVDAMGKEAGTTSFALDSTDIEALYRSRTNASSSQGAWC